MLILDHESNYANAQDGQSLRRIMLFAFHPNRFFYRNKDENLTQDKFIEIAAKIARINYARGYYRDQKWQMCVPPNHLSLMKRKYLEAYLGKGSDDALPSGFVTIILGLCLEIATTSCTENDAVRESEAKELRQECSELRDAAKRAGEAAKKVTDAEARI